jgi:hypothetical protein
MKSKEFYSTTAWKYFRKWVILMYAQKASDGNYYCKCATSGKMLRVGDKNLHLGHYIKVFNGSQTNFAVAFDERNVAPQSAAENVYKGGNEEKMLDYLEAKWGKQEIEKLRIRKNNICKLDAYTLDLMAKDFKSRLESLIKIKGNPFK